MTCPQVSARLPQEAECCFSSKKKKKPPFSPLPSARSPILPSPMCRYTPRVDTGVWAADWALCLAPREGGRNGDAARMAMHANEWRQGSQGGGRTRPKRKPEANDAHRPLCTSPAPHPTVSPFGTVSLPPTHQRNLAWESPLWGSPPF